MSFFCYMWFIFDNCLLQALLFKVTYSVLVSHWLLNTPRNVCLLEKHVTREIEAFMQNQADLEQDFASELQFNVNNDLLGSARFKLKEVQKVGANFNVLL